MRPLQHTSSTKRKEQDDFGDDKIKTKIKENKMLNQTKKKKNGKICERKRIDERKHVNSVFFSLSRRCCRCRHRPPSSLTNTFKTNFILQID